MIGWVTRFIGKGTIWIVLVAALAGGVFEIVKPTRPQATPAQQKAALELSDQVANWLRAMEIPRHSAVFLILGRDPFEIVSEPLRHAVWRSDRFDLADYSTVEKYYRVLRWSRPTVDNRDQAIASARRRDCRYAIWGELERFFALKGQAMAVVRLEIVDTLENNLLATETFTAHSRGLTDFASVDGSSSAGGYGLSFARRLLIWLAVTIFLPLLAFPLSRRVLTGDSNAAIIALLAGHVAVSTGLAYVFFAMRGGGIISGLFVLATFALSLLYTWYALEKIKTVSE